jgi:pimeloyl-ACP methyl ester carboxylesterase
MTRARPAPLSPDRGIAPVACDLMTLPTRLFQLPDGRHSAYCDGGDPDGYPVIGLHGTPGCRFSRWPAESLYIEAAVRYITPDRAGYGQAARKPGRTVADEAADVLGVHGWVDDTLSQLSPWGFDLSQITVPVLLSYGLKDAFTPPAHGHWLAAHLPTATVQVDTEAGHTGTDYEAELTRELTWLRGA